jgi:hypothetical protein
MSGQWQHVITIAFIGGGFYFGKQADTLANTAATLALFGLAASHGFFVDGTIYEQTRKERIIQERASGQLTVEEENGFIARARVWLMDHPTKTTSGNVNIPVPVQADTVKAVKKEAPEVFEKFQFETTTPRLDDTYIRRGIKRICTRQLHQRQQYPDGDYREASWLRTFGGPFPREELKVYLGILEYAGGIARKTSNPKSSFVTVGEAAWGVVADGARGKHLPHPDKCECGECQP